MVSATTTCVEIDTLDHLRTYEATWRELFDQSSQPSPFATWEWFYNWWLHFGSYDASRDETAKSPLLLLKAHTNSGELIALIPLYFAYQSAGDMRITVLRMVGDLEAVGENPTEEPIALLKRGYELDALSALKRFLRNSPNSVRDWSYVSLALPYVNASKRTYRAIPDSARKSGVTLISRRVSTAEMLDLPDSWNAFYKTLSKSMRDNLKYYPKLLERHGHRSSIRIAGTDDELRGAANALTSLHRLRSASARGTPHANHLPNESHRSFLGDCLSSLGSRGMAKIYLLQINGNIVAAQSVLESPDGICLYYSGFDPEWYQYSPVTVLTTAILQDAIGRGVTRVNLLSGAKLWKSRWGAKSRDRFERVIRLRWRLPSLLRCAAFQWTLMFKPPEKNGPTNVEQAILRRSR